MHKVIQIDSELRFYEKLGWNLELVKQATNIISCNAQVDSFNQRYFPLSINNGEYDAQQLYRNEIIPLQRERELTT